MTTYYRPLLLTGAPQSKGALPLAGGSRWFSDVVAMRRNATPKVVSVKDVPDDILERLTSKRSTISGCDMSAPNVMGILNVTPDSFSDGGKYFNPAAAVEQAKDMAAAGAQIIDIGGESTRPGAATVAVEEEIDRVSGPIAALSAELDIPVSIDTRKSPVAKAALNAGATLVNDVSGFTYDTDLASVCAEHGVPVCVMHAQGDPQTMQNAPSYDDVRFDVYDFLESRIDTLVASGISRTQIIIDPGIGFGKTLAHNILLLRDISLFHSLGCPVLLGASRKKFIGTISGADVADTRMPGSVAVALHAVSQGVQIIRVHDVLETRQAIALWRAVELGEA